MGDTGITKSVIAMDEISAWTWHTMPRAVESGGYTFWGSVTRTAGDESGIIVSSYDHRTGACESSPVVLKVGGADDHCNPSVWARPDGRLLLGAAGHTSDRLWFAISQDPGDISRWREVVSVRPGNFARYSYSQMVFLADEGKDGRVYWFFRGRGSANPVHHKAIRLRGYANWWAYATSDDHGETWSSGKILWRERGVNVPYTHIASNGRDTLFFSRSDVVDRADSSRRRHVMACRYKAGVFSRLDGTQICTERQLPMTRHGVLDLVYDSEAAGNHPAFNLDLALDTDDRPVIAFSTLEPASGLPGYTNLYHVARWTGAAWDVGQVADGGPSIYAGSGHRHYSGAMSIDRGDSDVVYLGVARLTDERVTCDIQRWRRSTDTGVWQSLGSVVDESVADQKHFRPVCPEGGEGPVRVLWLSGEYHSYTDWSTRVRGLVEPR